MIRIATEHDLKNIAEIYHQAVDAGFQTGYTRHLTQAEWRAFFDEHTPDRHPLLVYVIDSIVVGWVSISAYRSGRDAFRDTAEVSYFIHKDHLHKGIGTQLLRHALELCRQLHYTIALAIIIDKNAPSIGLMEKFGFERWAYLPGVANFDGIACSHVYYGLRL